ncbi:MAG: HAMP domain-containing protein, partial [Planctomycetota bacterium]
MRLRFRGQVLLLFAMLFLAGWALASMLLSNHLTAVVEADLVRHGRVLATNLAGWSEEPALTEESVDLRRLLERTREFNPEVTYVFVLGPNGNVVASTLGPPFPSALGRATLGRDRTLLRTEEGPIVDIRAPILQGRGGEVHVGYSRAALHAGVVRLRMALWLIAVPVLLVGLLGLWFLSGYVTRPARDLADAVRRFGSGDLDARARAGGPGELSVLARAFNEMAATHQRQAAELRFLSEYNRRLIDNLGAALYVVDGDLELEFANREVAESRDRLAGRRCYEALYGRAEPCPACPALG